MEPLVVEFEVDAPVAHAFEVWTARPSLWWPRGHTVTNDPETQIVFEPFGGGRIFERGPDGAEHEWGEILEWAPPGRLAFLWHVFFARREATEVVMTFTPAGRGTRVRIEQTGFERLGDPAGSERRTRTESAWSTIAQIFGDAASSLRPA